MKNFWRMASARGVDWRFGVALLASALLPVLASELSIHLRVGADRNYPGRVMDSAVVVGLVAPVAVLARTLQDRTALIAAAAPRPLPVQRIHWLIALFAVTFIVGVPISSSVSVADSFQMVLTDLILLLGLAILGAVLFGAALAWLLPAVVALCASTPGLVPLQYNLVMLVDKLSNLRWITVSVCALSVISYVALDDYGLARQRRLIQRVPGVADD